MSVAMTAFALGLELIEQKEVERKRRDLINEGITALSKCLPPGSEKMGKGQILSMAANMLTDMAAGRPVNTGGSRGQDDEVISALQVCSASHYQAYLPGCQMGRELICLV